MSLYEYKVTPAPAKSQKGKGNGDAETRFAQTLSDTLNQEANKGWEFVRAETLPVEERAGLTGTKTVFRSVLIYRRARGIAESDATREALKMLEERPETP